MTTVTTAVAVVATAVAASAAAVAAAVDDLDVDDPYAAADDIALLQKQASALNEQARLLRQRLLQALTEEMLPYFKEYYMDDDALYVTFFAGVRNLVTDERLVAACEVLFDSGLMPEADTFAREMLRDYMFVQLGVHPLAEIEYSKTFEAKGVVPPVVV